MKETNANVFSFEKYMYICIYKQTYTDLNTDMLSWAMLTLLPIAVRAFQALTEMHRLTDQKKKWESGSCVTNKAKPNHTYHSLQKKITEAWIGVFKDMKGA